MQLYHWKEPGGNFGDDLNVWLWPRVFPGALDRDDGILFIGIGTLLTAALPPEPLKVVFGTGAWKGRTLPTIDPRYRIYFVRGPLTCAVLGLPPALALTDPAILLRRYIQPRSDTSGDVAYMPHHWSHVKGEWRQAVSDAGLRYIDPTGPVENVAAEIRQSGLLVTEALHGAVVADALRVPWIPVKSFGHILDFKWQDWCASLELSHQPQRLPFIWKRAERPSLMASVRGHTKEWVVARQLRRIVRHLEPQLSKGTVSNSRYDGVLQQVQRLTDDLPTL